MGLNGNISAYINIPYGCFWEEYSCRKLFRGQCVFIWNTFHSCQLLLRAEVIIFSTSRCAMILIKWKYLKINVVFQCTNKKAWKDIAAQLGIGPSSSGAYTLKVSPGCLCEPPAIDSSAWGWNILIRDFSSVSASHNPLSIVVVSGCSSRIRIFPFRIQGQKDSGSALTQNNLS